MKTKTRTKVKPTLWWAIVRIIKTVPVAESGTTITNETIDPDDIFLIGQPRGSLSEEYFLSDDKRIRELHGSVLVACPLGSNRIEEIRNLRTGMSACAQCGQIIPNSEKLGGLPPSWEPGSICLNCRNPISVDRRQFLRRL